MQGIVLAAGGGTRLRPLTDDLPKTLLEVTDDGRSILELAIANLADVGITQITVVTGHAAGAIERLVETFEERYQVTVSLRFNDRYAEWNNAYSVWLVRDVFAQGALLVNGDTVHPVDVQRRLLDARGAAPVLLAVDDDKQLGEEEMKVQLQEGRLTRITKLMEPELAHGEYIGLTLIEADAGQQLAESLEATFERDPGLYYEDGYQELADRGGELRAVPIGVGVAWVEVDNHDDLARARTLTRDA
ncbi:MAG: phosphocholine cytidylyltransferase family protein [Nitriliruptoraceae bacterium]|nr:phosphocholine cytidylyltransferase family protein [Nitriliruptoraceae bacterium]